MAIFPILSRYRAIARALVRRVERIESGVRAQNRELRRATTLLVRSQIALEALVRRAYLDIEQLPYPERLTAQRFRILSQNAEDGIVLALLREAGVARARFVEIGCGTNGGNSGFLASELGWSGLMIDGSPAALAEARIRFNPERVRFVEALVTRENVNDLLSGNSVENEPDLLSIDIDGNDYWVLEAIEACSPRLLICEYNAAFGPTRSVSVPYDPGSSYASGSAYFGASLSAFTALARRKGYRLVVVEPRGANAFFLRDDVATHVPACEPVDVFRPLVAPRQQFADVLSERAAEKLLAAEKMLERELIDRGLSLVEIA